MRALSLCSGVGMLDLAAEQAGIEIVGQVEIDPWCSACLAYHWPGVTRMTDINKVQGNEFGAIDILFGGIPCQPFSSSGKQRGMQDDRYLWPKTLAIITTARPRWVVIENVSNFLPMVFDTVSSDMEMQGYEVGAALLPACALDASHVRERAVIAAHTNSQQRDRWQGLSGRWDTLSTPTHGIDIDRRGGQGMANTPRQRCERDTQARWQARRGAEYTGDVGDPDRARCQEHEHAPNGSAEGRLDRRHDAQRTAGLSQSGLGRATDGAARGLDRRTDPAFQGQAQYQWEAPRTVSRRKANHAHRLKALGNGVYVPLWREIFSIIYQIDREAA